MASIQLNLLLFLRNPMRLALLNYDCYSPAEDTISKKTAWGQEPINNAEVQWCFPEELLPNVTRSFESLASVIESIN